MRRWIAPLLATAVALGPLVGRTQPSPAPPSVADTRAFGGVSEARILEAIRSARVLGRQNVGSTSVNLHLRLEGGIDAAWKPRTTSHGESYRAEIAAYRLNRLLGLNRVPPAISRPIQRSALRLAPDSPVIFDRDNTARGAAIYWVPVLRPSRIDGVEDQERWGRWLRQGRTVPPDQSQRAEEISTLLVFDFLTGNWDRWSGANVPMDAQGHLIYRDNNGGFLEPLPRWKMEIIFSFLQRVQRFSRRFVDQVRAMTLASLRRAIANDADGTEPLLNDAQLRAMMRRRATFLEYVDALVGIHGASEVYFFD